ncbi:hypothetical protein [Mycetocola sp.]|jgi:hypothetical protein|uniref:hypothetical protein n=1 Tax=Mycetocola sp. TaxID=1871042 RepID=UPI00262A15FC|nr:hypothetical protein [Mycetocola sp.]MCU1419249.1 hypothetical protein [Mycetocola sp.]MCU1560257.1 hypothetical protein [Mycetocola sp.]
MTDSIQGTDARTPAGSARSARGGGLALVVTLGGILLAAWIVAGRVLFGVSGVLVPVFALTLGPLIVLLHVLAGLGIRRAVRAGYRIRPSTVVPLVMSWISGVLFGLTVPEAMPELRSVLADGSEPWAVEMSTALCNPLAIICVGTSVAAVIFAHVNARGPVADPGDDELAPADTGRPERVLPRTLE